MKRCTAVICVGLFCASLSAEEAPASDSFTSVKCTKEELMRFFPDQIVESLLEKKGVAVEKAKAIAQDLALRDVELAKKVEERSGKLDFNPLKTPNQREAAAKIYRETLHEVFSKVLKENGITDEAEIQSLLDDLQEARSKLFIECIRRQVTSS